MQPSIIAIFIFCIGFAVLSYYLGFKLPYFVLQFYSQAVFVCLVFMLIPFLVYALWAQNGELERLHETGIIPHPLIHHSVGLTTVLTQTPTWVFAVDPSLESATEFYSSESNRRGWSFSNDDPEMLILKRNNETMTVSVTNTRGNASIIYMLSSK